MQLVQCKISSDLYPLADDEEEFALLLHVIAVLGSIKLRIIRYLCLDHLSFIMNSVQCC